MAGGFSIGLAFCLLDWIGLDCVVGEGRERAGEGFWGHKRGRGGNIHLGEFRGCASSDFLCAEGAEFGLEVDELRF